MTNYSTYNMIHWCVIKRKKKKTKKQKSTTSKSVTMYSWKLNLNTDECKESGGIMKKMLTQFLHTHYTYCWTNDRFFTFPMYQLIWMLPLLLLLFVFGVVVVALLSSIDKKKKFIFKIIWISAFTDFFFFLKRCK